MLTVWGRTNSNNVKKVLWCLEELGLHYQRHDVGGQFGGVDTPQYRALNPNGLIPTLQDGDLTLWESNAIVRYLLAEYGGDSWWPQQARARAEADKWLDWASTTFVAPFRIAFVGWIRTAPEQRNEALLATAAAEAAALLARVEPVLAAQPYLSGERIGHGDIALGTLIYPWLQLPIERPSLPALEDWAARLAQRPAYQRSIMTVLS